MSNKKDNIDNEDKDKELENTENDEKKKESTSQKNIKRIRKHLMSFAKDEILNIKKSKKEISIANFENKEIIAPSRYSLTTKYVKTQSFQNYKSYIEPVEEEVKKEQNDINIEDKKKEGKKEDKNKNEVSSSDISDDDEE